MLTLVLVLVFVLVLALLQLRLLHALQHHAVLLQHHSVACFQAVAVQKAPHVALPALHAAAAPEEHRAQVGADGRVAANHGTTASHNNVKDARTERSRFSGIEGLGTNKGIAWRFIAAMMTTPSTIASVQYNP